MALDAELAALIAAGQDSAFDAHLAVARAEVNAAVTPIDDTACLAALQVQVSQRAQREQSTIVELAEAATQNTNAANTQGYINAVDQQIIDLEAEYDDLVANQNGSGNQQAVRQEIIDNRVALERTSATGPHHFMLPKTFDYKGVVNVGLALRQYVPRTGTPTNPVTVDLWPGSTLLIDDESLLSTRFDTTYCLHGSTVKVTPAIDLGTCTVDGVTPITGSYTSGATFITCNVPLGPQVTATGFDGKRVANRKFPLPSTNDVGLPTTVTITSVVVTGAAITRLNLSLPTTMAKTNQALYVDDRSRRVVSNGIGAGGAAVGPWRTRDLIGKGYIMRDGGIGAVPTRCIIEGALDGAGVLIPYNSTATSYTFGLTMRNAPGGSANKDATGLALAVSGGSSTTPHLKDSYPDVRNREQFNFDRGQRCRLTGLGAPAVAGGVPQWGKIIGAVPDHWNDSVQPSCPAYHPDLEGQAAIGVNGAVDLEIDHLRIEKVWGNFATMQAHTTATVITETDGVDMHHIVGDRTARQAVAPVRCRNVIIRDSTYTNIGRTVFDPEPYVASSTVDGLQILRVTVGENAMGGFVAAVGQGTVNNVRIADCVSLVGTISVTATAIRYQKSVDDNAPNEALRWHDWVIEGNTGVGAHGVGGQSQQTGLPKVGHVSVLTGIRNIAYRNNFQNMRLIFSTPSMVHLLGEIVSGVIDVSGNTGSNALAQAKINGVLTGSARVGLPATGAYWGGVFNPKPPVGGSIQAATAAMEVRFGTGYKFGAHRIYTQPADGFLPNAKQALLDDDRVNGRISYLSLSLPAGATWQSMINNPTLLQMAADQLRDRSNAGCKIVIMADHEPDVDDNGAATHATPSEQARLRRLEFAAFTAAFMTRVRTTAPQVTRAMCFGGWKLYNSNLTQAQWLEWLPTDKSLLELVGEGPYNDNNTVGGPTFAQRIAKYLTMIAAYGKPGFIHEMGILTAAGDKAAWWRGAFATMKANPQLKAIMCYHSSGGAALDPLHDYWIDDTVAMFADIRSASVGSGQAYFHP